MGFDKSILQCITKNQGYIYKYNAMNRHPLEQLVFKPQRMKYLS
jgi:hypothetical protein